jgi:hypothetical protein
MLGMRFSQDLFYKKPLFYEKTLFYKKTLFHEQTSLLREDPHPRDNLDRKSVSVMPRSELAQPRVAHPPSSRA